jgi:superfamily II DNA/RNA helicase
VSDTLSSSDASADASTTSAPDAPASIGAQHELIDLEFEIDVDELFADDLDEIEAIIDLGETDLDIDDLDADDIDDDDLDDDADVDAPAARPSFVSLGVPTRIADQLASEGIVDAFPVQALTLPDALAGRDLCGRAPTGSGKTLGFGIPLMARVSQAKPNRPTGLVLVPTRELAEQVQRAFIPLGRAQWRFVQAVYGGAPMAPQIHSLRKGASVVVATPGRLLDLIDQGHCDLGAVEVCVIDEADRMADLGFMPDVRTILDMTPATRQTMLWSATLDGDVDELIREYLRDPARHDLVGEIDRGHVEHRFVVTHPAKRIDDIVELLDEHDSAIVFVTTRFGVDDVTAALMNLGIRAGALHGARTQGARTRTLEDFKRGRIQVLVATDVAARGIHVDAVDVVIHHDLPANDKDYLHRSGRTGRAGESGLVVAMVPPSRRKVARRMLDDLSSAELDVTWEDPNDRGEPMRRTERGGRRTRDDRPSADTRSEAPAADSRRDSSIDDRPAAGRAPRPHRHERDARAERPAGDDRPARREWTSERPARDDRGPRTEWTPRGDRDDRGPRRESSERPGRDDRGGRTDWAPRGDRPSSDRARADRPAGDRGYGDRPRGDRPYGDRARSDRPAGDRPYGDRPRGDRPAGDRPYGDRARSDRPAGDRPYGDRPRGDRPYGDRPRGARPYGDRNARPAGNGRPVKVDRNGNARSDRPAWSAERPSWQDRQRDERGDRSAAPRRDSGPSSHGRSARPEYDGRSTRPTSDPYGRRTPQRDNYSARSGDDRPRRRD